MVPKDELQYWKGFSDPHKEGSIKGVGWNSPDVLAIRYYEILKYLSSGERILDVGCGYGHLYKFLTCVPSFDASNYEGSDIQEDLISFCKKMYPEVSWEVREFMSGVEEDQFDTIVFCGSLARSNVKEVTEIIEEGLKVGSHIVISFCCDKATKRTEGIWFPKISEVVSAVELIDAPFEVVYGYLNHDALIRVYRWGK